MLMSYAVYEELTENFVDERKEYDKWIAKKEQEIKEKKEKLKQEKIQKQIKDKEEFEQTLIEIREKFGDYWEYNDILIPWEVRKIIALDGYNYVSWFLMDKKDKPTIMETSVAVSKNKWTLENYRKEFAVLKEDGKWYWNC